MSIVLTSKDCSSDIPIQGIKAVRQLKLSHEATSGSKRRSARQEKQKELTFNYFTKEIDPLVGECVTQLLCSQPENVAAAMLEYLKCRKNGSKILGSQDRSLKAKKSQRLYLATQVTPVITKLINKLARDRPQNALDYMCRELESIKILEEQRLLNKQDVQDQGSYRPSTAKSKLNDAKELAEALNAMPSAVQRAESAPVLARDNKHDTLPVPAVPSIQIVLLGPGSSGKTSVLNTLQGNFNAKTRPTLGFRPVSMMLGDDLKIRFYDLGGGKKIRDIWSQYYHDAHGVIYVLDAAGTREELDESIDIFHRTVNHLYLSGKPILVLANKRDKEGALSDVQLRRLMNLDRYLNCQIYSTCSGTGSPEVDEDSTPTENDDSRAAALAASGVEEALEWLFGIVKKNFDSLNKRVSYDTAKIADLEASKRLEKERKVLKKKIACAFPDKVDTHLYTEELPTAPEDVFTAAEGVTFLAGEVGIEPSAMPSEAVEVASLVGHQRLALQMVGALNAPINKKKSPMSWHDIKTLLLELRMELGLPIL